MDSMTATDRTIKSSLMEPPDGSHAVTGPAIHAAYRQRLRDYAGGLPAERGSVRYYSRAQRAAYRASWLRQRGGRRIDLESLLAMTRLVDDERVPVWALADPAREIEPRQGRWWPTNGLVTPGNKGDIIYHIGGVQWHIPSSHTVETVIPGGMPPLPPAVRRLATDRHIRRRAKLIMVLWQPDEWLRVDPDPALIVEWKDLPDEYYCLACWGHDGPVIEEFYR